ncbi:hypothetical protein HAX54_042539 [Datura stramonium]|uniref:Uncharacterized protein n=1 Tax=Datura stramonium TaxID=4076 RepID=A0ABS8W4F9_DATST|nr:hypothetical protein [Datura stramonium]
MLLFSSSSFSPSTDDTDCTIVADRLHHCRYFVFFGKTNNHHQRCTSNSLILLADAIRPPTEPLLFISGQWSSNNAIEDFAIDGIIIKEYVSYQELVWTIVK